jgi:uncharacterized protein YndB with AHSA1/START domain
MKWVLIAGATLAVVVLLAWVAGSLLPVAHTASVEATVPAPPEAVWRLITDVEGFRAWRPELTRVERLAPGDGQPVWIEESPSGRITLGVERAEPPRVLVLRIVDKDLPFGGAWTYELTPTAEGTALRITENGEIYNPFFRLMARVIFGYDGTIKAYLDAVGRHVRQPQPTD